MSKLPPDILREFNEGSFGVQWKDESPFSAVDVNHATEWINRIGKKCGVIAGITQSDYS